ncbi:hypothetical protein KEM55_007745 [Ascosphaera atra]|nr:hypothetical protein KEM55_007745 [Ascosphaera atra]
MAQREEMAAKEKQVQDDIEQGGAKQAETEMEKGMEDMRRDHDEQGEENENEEKEEDEEDEPDAKRVRLERLEDALVMTEPSLF